MSQNSTGRIVLGYCGSTNGQVMRRQLYALAMQEERDRLQPPLPQYEMILVTDKPVDELPSMVVEHFGRDRILHSPNPWMTNEFGTHFNMSAQRNMLLDYVTEHAEERDYRWLVLCDCDTVFPKSMWQEPRSPFAAPQVYWQKHANETLSESLAAIGDGSDISVFSKGNSWFMLRRELFTRFRLSEQVFGYGHEDIEYSARLRLNGYDPDMINLPVVHAWHSNGDRNINKPQLDRNAVFTEATRALLIRGPSFTEPPTLRFIKATRWNWKVGRELALVTSHNRLFYPGDGNWADYTLDGDQLVINWDKFPAERFREVDGVFESTDVPPAGASLAAVREEKETQLSAQDLVTDHWTR